MKWYNLTQNLCPKCGGGLKSDGSLLDPTFFCIDKCGFTIGESKIDAILRDRHNEVKKEYNRVNALPSDPRLNAQPTRKDLKVRNYNELKSYL